MRAWQGIRQAVVVSTKFKPNYAEARMTSPSLNTWKLFPSLCSWLSHKLWWILSADSPRHTLILLRFICVRLPSVNSREGRQEMDVEEGKSQGLLSCPSCWLLWGFSTSSCQVVFTIQLSPWSSGPPTTFAFSSGGVETLLKPPAYVTALASAVSLHSKQPLYHTPRLLEWIICFLPGLWYTRVLRHHMSSIKTVEDKSIITKEKGKWY